MSEIVDHTIPIQEETKADRSYSDPDCIYSWKKTPVSRPLIDRLIEELPEWPAKHPEEVTLSDFYLSYHISERTRYRLLEKHSDLKEAHDIAMEILGNRLWNRSIKRQYDWSAVKFRLHRYSQEFAEDKVYEANLRTEAENKKAQSGGNKEYIYEVKTVYVDKKDE